MENLISLHIVGSNYYQYEGLDLETTFICFGAIAFLIFIYQVMAYFTNPLGKNVELKQFNFDMRVTSPFLISEYKEGVVSNHLGKKKRLYQVIAIVLVLFLLTVPFDNILSSDYYSYYL